MGGMEQSPVSRMTPVDLPSSATYCPALPLGRRRSSFWNVVLLLVDDATRRLGMVARSLTLGASRYLPVPRMSGWSAGSTSDVGGHDVRGVAVLGHPGPVVTHRGPWVGVAGGLLHVSQWHPSIDGYDGHGSGLRHVCRSEHCSGHENLRRHLVQLLQPCVRGPLRRRPHPVQPGHRARLLSLPTTKEVSPREAPPAAHSGHRHARRGRRRAPR